MIYLDSASTTPMTEPVIKAMMPYLTTQYGNPNSIHTLGIEARKAVDKAREQVAEIINAEPNQIVFTSGGSEANNLVLHGIRKVFPSIEIISSRMEHTSSIRALESVQNKSLVSFVEDLEDDYETHWATLLWKMYVNNEVGQVTNVYDIGEACYGNDNYLFGTDCVQALGFERIDVKEMMCDFLTMSAHKIHGPKGVGALYVRDKELIKPIINGGVNQEFGLRGGTENVAGIVGFGAACDIALKNREENRKRIIYLRELFLENLKDIRYNLNCKDESKILSIEFPNIDAETFVLALSSFDIAVSSGSACRNKESIVNQALLSYGLTENQARNTVRFSFSDINREDEVIEAAKRVKGIINMFGKLKGGM